MKKLILQQAEKFKEFIEGEGPEVVLNAIPKKFMETMTQYLRVEIEGLENIPKRSSAVIAPNHSGFSGLDAMILNYEVFNRTGRVARVLTHRLWFVSPKLSARVKRLGFIKASLANGVKTLKKGKILIIFPEGEDGNFKSSRQMYVLQEFKRGFVRMALEAQAPIVPTLIIGAEETHLNAAKLKLPKWMQGIVMPLPLNLIPLPAKWKIIFLEPMELPYNADAATDNDLVREIAEEIQEKMQKKLNDVIANRTTVYL